MLSLSCSFSPRRTRRARRLLREQYGRRAHPAARRALALLGALATLPSPLALRAQTDTATRAAARHDNSVVRRDIIPDTLALDSLVAAALAVSPAVHAADAALRAAQARVNPAGARPDPMLMAGLQNFPIFHPGFTDFMTMKMIGIGQTFPFPGKLSLQTRVATDEVAAAAAALDAARLDAAAEVKKAYYALAFADRALDIVRRNQAVLTNLIAVSQAHYETGTGTQADVLRANTETANLGVAASSLTEDRRAALARLNAALDRPSDAPVASPVIPPNIVRAAVADSSDHVRFASAELGARAADSPLLPVDSLQALAIASSSTLHEHEANIAAQRDRLRLAEKAHDPDINVSLSYGQRQGFTDMFSATVSIPIPVQHGRKQDAEVAAASADLAMLEAQHHQMINAMNAEVAKEVSDLEQARTELALSKRAIVPEAQATLASATASYEVGRLDFAAVMDAQASVFNAEISYYRSLTEFAKNLADLERTVGAGVLR